ncbi:UNVERIFIED_CONTAM: Formin-binding protein 1 [Gekko kuhli]
MKTFAEVDRQVVPIIGKCLDEITRAAESIHQKNDSQLVIEAFKSGFEPPGDVDFEDFTQPIKRAVSESSLSNSKDGKPESRFSSKSKGKLWPFIKKNKSPKQQKEPLSHRFNEFMTSKPKIHCFRSLKRGPPGVCAPSLCPVRSGLKYLYSWRSGGHKPFMRERPEVNLKGLSVPLLLLLRAPLLLCGQKKSWNSRQLLIFLGTVKGWGFPKKGKECGIIGIARREKRSSEFSAGMG